MSSSKPIKQRCDEGAEVQSAGISLSGTAKSVTGTDSNIMTGSLSSGNHIGIYPSDFLTKVCSSYARCKHTAHIR